MGSAQVALGCDWQQQGASTDTCYKHHNYLNAVTEHNADVLKENIGNKQNLEILNSVSH